MKKYMKFLSNKRRWFFIGLGVVIITATAASIAKRHRGFYKMMPKEEVKAYFETNIKPVLTEYRTSLDSELTAEEKQQVTEVREALKTLKESKHELGKALREKRKNGEEITTEEEAEIRATMRQMRKLTQSAWDITDAHSDFFDNMLASTETQRKQWKEDIHEIVKTYREAKKEEFKNREGIHSEGSEGPREGRRGRRGGKHKGFDGMGRHHGGPGAFGPIMSLAGPHKEVMFLLWDLANPFINEDDEAGSDENVVVYPNPAFDGSSLSYKVQKGGNVTITLLNTKGEIVATLLEKQLEVGDYTLDNDVSQLQKGVYFYKITTAEGTVTRSFIKK